MQRNRLARRKVLTLGLASGLLVLSLATAQIAMAGPSAGPTAQTSTIPTPGPTPPPPPPIPTPPAGSDTTTVSYSWAAPLSQDIPLSDDAGAPGANISLPARAMSVDGLPASGNISVEPLDTIPDVNSETLPDNPTATFLGRSVTINVTGANANMAGAEDVTSRVRFNPPLVLSFDITQEEWEAAGQNPDAFQIRFFSTTLNKWISIPTTVDPFNTPIRARGTTSHLTTFALFDAPPAPAPDGGDFSFGAGILAVMALMGVALVGSGAYYLRRNPRTIA